MRPSASVRAIEPPPAPISTMSITGMRTGMPLPLHEACGARDLEVPAVLRPQIVDQRDLAPSCHPCRS
jgi:hypothetical protein